MTRTARATRKPRTRPTHCLHGHPLTVENARLRANGTRACRVCDRIRMRPNLERSPEDGYAVDKLADPPAWDGDAPFDLVSAICRQAIHDYLTGYRTPHTPDAATFLRLCGLLDEQGRIDTHGHGPVPVIVKRQRRTA